MNGLQKTYVRQGDLKSDLFSLTINEAAVSICAFPGVDYERCIEISRQYQQHPHDNMKLPARDMAVHYAHIQLNPHGASPEITLTAPEEIIRYSIHPARHKIDGCMDGNRLTFHPAEKFPYILVSINDLPMVCLILELDLPAACDPEDELVVNFRQFLPADWANEDCSDAFRQAISALNGSGKTLYIPTGTYNTDTISIRACADFNICFSDDCLIKTRLSEPGENRKSPGIWIENSRNIRLFGRGCIDQQGYENYADFRNDYSHNFVSNEFYQNVEPLAADDPLLTSALLITRSTDIAVEELTFRNGRCWNISGKASDRLSFTNCKVITPPASLAEWADGFNFGCCNHVRIKDCLTYCNDDSFAGAHCLAPFDTGGGGDCVVDGLVGYSARAHAVRLGWACKWEQGDYTFRNCDFIRSTTILIHELKDPSGKIVPYGKIHFENCGFDGPPGFGVDSTAINKLEFDDVQWQQ